MFYRNGETILKISIITVNFNDEEGLSQTLESVQNQTYFNFEHIIIDGGSTDNSRKLLEKNSPKINYWVSEKDSGIYNAMNKGLRVANGDYILMLNAGDALFNENTLSDIRPDLESGEGIIYGNSLDVNFPDGREDFIRKYPNHLTFQFLKENALRHQATFIHRDVYDCLGFYSEKFRIVSDWKFILDAKAKLNIKSKYVDKIICRYDRNGISCTNRILNDEERKQVLEQDYEFYISNYRESKPRRTLNSHLKLAIKSLIPYGLVQLIKQSRLKK